MSQVASPQVRHRSGTLTPRERAFVEAYTGAANLNAAMAARLAGYEGDSHALQAAGWRVLGRSRVRRAVDRRLKGRIAGPAELMTKLTEVATAPWKDFVKVVTDEEGTIISATLPLGDQLKAADMLLKAHGTYLDPLTRALGKLAMLEVQRMLKAKRRAARAASLDAGNPKLLAPAPDADDDAVDAEVVVPGQGKDEQGKA